MARIVPDNPPSLAKPAPARRSARYKLLIRLCPCLICRREPCGEAAHVSMGQNRGKSQKVDDRRTVPLCHEHHMDQHNSGERVFWHFHKIDVEQVIRELNAAFPDRDAMAAVSRRQS